MNGNAMVQLCAGVTENLNIRQVKLYHKPTVQTADMLTNRVVPEQPVGH